jgi:NitT/TauT family transport system permease protein
MVTTKQSAKRKAVADDDVMAVPQGRGVQSVLYGIGAFAALLAIWHFSVVILDINSTLLPPVTDVVATLIESWRLLLQNARITLVEALLGFALAIGIGVPLGMAITFSRHARDTIYPVLVSSQMIPKVALAPLFLVWFGLDLAPKVAMAFLLGFFSVVVSTALGMRAVDKDMVRLFRSMGSGRISTFFRLRLPTALPSMFAGFKLAMTQALVGAIVGEFISANSGLGYYILFNNGQLRTSEVFAGLIVAALMGVLMFFGLELIERLLSPHRRRGKRTVPAGKLEPSM